LPGNLLTITENLLTSHKRALGVETIRQDKLLRRRNQVLHEVEVPEFVHQYKELVFLGQDLGLRVGKASGGTERKQRARIRKGLAEIT